jgi:hypothetical protein
MAFGKVKSEIGAIHRNQIGNRCHPQKSVPPKVIADENRKSVPPTEIGATQSDWHKVIGATQGNWWSYGGRWVWMSNSTSVHEGKSMVICG